MEITNNLLAAYAEGNVSPTERQTVRQYLADTPSELETMMIMMDDDYDIQADDSTESREPISKDENFFSDICYSAAAFAPLIVTKKNTFENQKKNNSGIFDQRLDELLNELES
jgi:hypothetical protein